MRLINNGENYYKSQQYTYFQFIKQISQLQIIDSLKTMNTEYLLSPDAGKFPRTDSLVFSITAEKDQDSPHDTDLLKNSYPIQASRDILNLNDKLGELQNKVKSIKTQQAEPQYKNITHNQNIDISNLTLGQEGFKAGRFHKKAVIQQVKHSNNNSSFNVTTRNNRSLSHESRASNLTNKTEIAQRNSQIKSMRKQMLKLRMKIQKQQRSKSRCSQKLSQSKQNIKNLLNTKKANQKLITNLVKDLKKCENIRKRQKQTIAKQKKQIDELKQLVAILKTSIKI